MTTNKQQNNGNHQEQMNTREGSVLDRWWRQLRWSASGHGWFARTDDLSIFVSESTYEKHLKAYLASQGIEWKTYADIMKPAEEAWKRQCEVVDRFQENLDYWKNCKDFGVEIREYQRAGKTKV